jgi:hypothetical protein
VTLQASNIMRKGCSCGQIVCIFKLKNEKNQYLIQQGKNLEVEMLVSSRI